MYFNPPAPRGGDGGSGHAGLQRGPAAADIPRAMRPLRLSLLPFLLALLAGCATAPLTAMRPGGAFDETGIASYYGREHAGHRTASGSRYDPGRLTAAHRTLPFGTRVRVTNLGNGRSVVVTVTDRGPFRRGRIIDVSARAARALDFVRAGTARVRVEVVGDEIVER
jgi:rare lipoprotein A